MIGYLQAIRPSQHNNRQSLTGKCIQGHGHIAAGRLVVLEFGEWDDKGLDLLFAFDSHFHVLKLLIVESINQIELKDHMLWEDVLDALHSILRLRFCELHRLGGLVQSAQGCKLWNRGQLLGVHIALGCHWLGWGEEN